MHGPIRMQTLGTKYKDEKRQDFVGMVWLVLSYKYKYKNKYKHTYKYEKMQDFVGMVWLV